MFRYETVGVNSATEGFMKIEITWKAIWVGFTFSFQDRKQKSDKQWGTYRQQLHPWSLTARPWKMVVGRRAFPIWGSVTFQGFLLLNFGRVLDEFGLKPNKIFKKFPPNILCMPGWAQIVGGGFPKPSGWGVSSRWISWKCVRPRKKVGPTNPNPAVKTKVPQESRRWPIRFSAQGDFFFQIFCRVLFFLSRGNTFLIVTTTKFGMSWSFSFGQIFLDFGWRCWLDGFLPVIFAKEATFDSHSMLPSCPRHVSSIFSEVTHGNSGGWSFGTCSEVRDHYMGPIWG